MDGGTEMAFDIKKLLHDNEGRNYALHREHINPRFAKVLHTIGFDRCYTRAQGPYLWDVHGNQYLDMLSGYGVFNVGRNHPYIRQALSDFLHTDYPSLVQMEAPLLSGLFAEALKGRMPNTLDFVYFTSSGTEGVETAIKFARCATERSRILYLDKAFHGLTNGALALNGDTVFRERFGPFLPGCDSLVMGDLEALKRALAQGDVAALVVEPVQGKGVNIAPPGYLVEAARLCREHGALFVADEVQSGIGRTGRFLALEHHGEVDPDLVILSKALSGGYVPVGAVLGRQWIYERVFSSLERAVVHSSTFGQGSLAMVAGLATLELIDEQALMSKAARLGDQIGAGLRDMQQRYEFIKDVRWSGLMIGIEFGRPESLGLRTAWSLSHKMDASLFPQAITMPLLDDHHILTQVAGHHMDVVKLLPSMTMTDADVERFLGAFEQVMKNLHRFPGPVWEALSKIGKHALGNRPAAPAAG